jgi:hypothetical protein
VFREEDSIAPNAVNPQDRKVVELLGSHVRTGVHAVVQGGTNCLPGRIFAVWVCRRTLLLH